MLICRLQCGVWVPWRLDPAVAEHEASSLWKDQLQHLAHEYAAGENIRLCCCEVWNHPVYTVWRYSARMNDALTLCGARNVFGDLKELSTVVDTEAVIARNPDIIVAAAPPSDGASWLAEWKRYTGLSAVRYGHLIAFEDKGLSRLGPSVLTATAGLCKALAAADGG